MKVVLKAALQERPERKVIHEFVSRQTQHFRLAREKRVRKSEVADAFYGVCTFQTSTRRAFLQKPLSASHLKTSRCVEQPSDSRQQLGFQFSEETKLCKSEGSNQPLYQTEAIGSWT